MSRLQRIEARRSALQREIADARAQTRAAAHGLRQEAALALAIGAASRWLPRRLRWGALAAAGVGLAVSWLLRKRGDPTA
jgi:hypothetical protein